MSDLSDDEFDALLGDAIAAADEAFNGTYKTEIEGLLGLSKAEIDAITPNDTTDLATYERLMAVVREASRKNVSQALLVSRIEALGDVAKSIARKVPSLAALL